MHALVRLPSVAETVTTVFGQSLACKQNGNAYESLNRSGRCKQLKEGVSPPPAVKHI